MMTVETSLRATRTLVVPIFCNLFLEDSTVLLELIDRFFFETRYIANGGYLTGRRHVLSVIPQLESFRDAGE